MLFRSQHIAEGEEKLWTAIRRVGDWVSDKVSSASGGRIQLRDSFEGDVGVSGLGISRARAAGDDGRIMDGTEDIVDDEGVEMENR